MGRRDFILTRASAVRMLLLSAATVLVLGDLPAEELGDEGSQAGLVALL